MSENLLELVKKGESEEVEFKKSTAQLDRALKSVCSFLNHKGGKVYFGISKGKIVGQEVSEQTLKSISQKIRQRIKPEISPEIKILEIEGKTIIEVKIKEGDNKPYYLDGIAYKRVGTENVVVPSEELERIILEKRKRYFDSEICEEASLEDIDDEKVRWFLRKAKVERDLDVDENTPVEEALRRLKLIKDGKLTNSAVLLFGRKLKDLFIQAEVRCARFKGTKAIKPFIDMKVFSGDIIDQVDKALNFVLEHIPMAAWLVPGEIERREKYEYPPDAVKEAIVNAIVHRDYSSTGNVQVRVFDDRIEIWNPGRLPEGWTVEKLKEEHDSIPKNPLIANQFFLIKLIEKWGTGTNDMINECINWGLPEPEFEFTGTSLVVTFRKAKLSEEILQALRLNERQKKAWEYVLINKKITNEDYRGLFPNISGETARLDFIDLVNKDILKKVGRTKGVYYILSPKLSPIYLQKSKIEGHTEDKKT